MEKPLARNPLTGVETNAVFNADGMIETIVERQSGAHVGAAEDMAKYFSENKVPMIGHSQNHRRHIAEIPHGVVNDLIRRGIWGDTPALLKWLQFEGQNFRSTPGRLV